MNNKRLGDSVKVKSIIIDIAIATIIVIITIFFTNIFFDKKIKNVIKKTAIVEQQNEDVLDNRANEETI